MVSYLSANSKKPINYPSIAGGPSERNTGNADLRRIVIRDGRRRETDFSLDIQGFALVEHRSRVSSWLDPAVLETEYAAEVGKLIAGATRADEVVVFDFTLRSDDESLRLARKLRDPSVKVHNDYTPRSAAQRVRDVLGAEAERRLQRRFAIVNIWRSMHGVVRTTPIALCDARSVDPANLVPVERRAEDRIGEIYQVTYSPDHEWYYFPDMHANEALLIKTYDSDLEVARFAPHCAFRDPAAPSDAAPRQSIEARAFVFY